MRLFGYHSAGAQINHSVALGPRSDTAPPPLIPPPLHPLTTSTRAPAIHPHIPSSPQHTATHNGRHNRSVSAARPQRPAPLFPDHPPPIPAAGQAADRSPLDGALQLRPANNTHFCNSDFCVATPMALRHEATGAIVAVGSAATDGRSVSDRVLLEVGIPCLRDPTCGSDGSGERPRVAGPREVGAEGGGAEEGGAGGSGGQGGTEGSGAEVSGAEGTVPTAPRAATYNLCERCANAAAPIRRRTCGHAVDPPQPLCCSISSVTPRRFHPLTHSAHGPCRAPEVENGGADCPTVSCSRPARQLWRAACRPTCSY